MSNAITFQILVNENYNLKTFLNLSSNPNLTHSQKTCQASSVMKPAKSMM